MDDLDIKNHIDGHGKRIYFIIAAIVVLVLAIVFVLYLWLTGPAQAPTQEESLTEDTTEESVESAEEANTYGTLPENTSLTNPVGGSTELNPVDKTNPFEGGYTNPFE